MGSSRAKCERATIPGLRSTGRDVDCRFDRADDLRCLREDLVSDLSPIDLNFPREVKGDTHAIALHRCDSNNPDWVLRITYYHLFTFTTSNDKHAETPILGPTEFT